MIPGIDVSNNQGAIDWAAVAGSGVQFALIKCSEGGTFEDACFAANWAGARSQLPARLAYHYARPDLNDPATEARWFLRCLQTGTGGLQPGEAVALDLEVAASKTQPLAEWTLGWLETVAASLGFKPLFYSSPSFMAGHGLLGNAALGEYGLWLASWGGELPAPPDPWPFAAIWQHSDAGAVPGITGPVDLDFFNGDDIDRLRAYGTPVPPPKPAFGDRERLQLIQYIAGGSGVSDIATWVGQYQ